MPGLIRPRRIYFAWKDELGTSGVFNIGCLNGASTVGLRQQSSQLAEGLNAWWKTSPTTRPLPAPLAALRSPQIGAVTGANPRTNAKPAKVFKELVWTGIFAIVGAVLCGLPFHFMAFLFSRLNESLGRLGAFHSPGSGWYVVAVALVVRFIAMIPILRYKDVAVVTLAPSRSQSSQVPATSNSQPEPVEVEGDKVLSR